MQSRGNESRDVRHIDHKVRSDVLRRLRDALEIDYSRISRCAGDDEFRTALFRLAVEFVVIYSFGHVVKTVGNEIVVFARNVDGTSVREVSAVRERHTHYRVACVAEGEIDRRVRLRAAVRLDVCVLRTEKFAGALFGEVFNYVDALATAVIAFCRVALGVFVGHYAACRRHYAVGNEIFRGDELYTAVFARVFGVYCRRYFGVAGGKYIVYFFDHDLVLFLLKY